MSQEQSAASLTRPCAAEARWRVDRERERQIALGYTREHDREHSRAEWRELVASLIHPDALATDFIGSMTKVAAVALAAVEATCVQWVAEPGDTRDDVPF